ncbi:hypothetical protein [Spongiactinospora gelatinilytica]|uniref:hypothetical protein n=1 Tax=Spongiactinospora gelatinilytica TaxID=2666298 RepID=UPI0011B941A2|nr:hypothetical protein [Spongiactinospora gelatinilytica]
MAALIRFDELPGDVPTIVTSDDGQPIIIVNTKLPKHERRAAIRAAQRQLRRDGALTVLPFVGWLAEQRDRAAAHPAPTATAVGLVALATVAVITASGAPSEPPTAQPRPPLTATYASPSPKADATQSANPTASSIPRPARTAAPVGDTRPQAPEREADRRRDPTPDRTPRRRPTTAPPSFSASPHPTSEPRPDDPVPEPPPGPEPQQPPEPDEPDRTTPPPPGPRPETTACDGIHVRVPLDPLVNVDACLLD